LYAAKAAGKNRYVIFEPPVEAGSPPSPTTRVQRIASSATIPR
jgi:hypothetical protein